MHGGNLVLGGPLWWISVTFFVAAWLLAAFVTFDAMRASRAERLGGLPESKWLYIVPSAAFVVLALVAQVAGVALLAMASVLAAPLVLVLAVVYLLRVVYPGRDVRRGEEQVMSEEEPSDTPE